MRARDVKKTVGEAFKELRASLENNMKHIYRPDDVNGSQAGHYPAALLIVVGSEALSQLQGREREDHVFIEMMAKHGMEKLLSRKLFDALRNGLAHIWDTNFLAATGREHVELIVSWKEKKGLYVNVGTMWSDLQKALDEYASVLQGDPRKAGAPAPVSVTSISESRAALEAWQRFTATAPKEET